MVIGAAIGTTLTGCWRRWAARYASVRLWPVCLIYQAASLLLLLRAAVDTEVGTNAPWPAGGQVSLCFPHPVHYIGVAVFLPQVHRCARQIERILPERSALPTRMLDKSQWQVPALALASSHQALRATAGALMDALAKLFIKTPGEAPFIRRLPADAVPMLGTAMDELQSYLARILYDDNADKLAGHRLYQMHVLDHLLRLHARAEQLPEAPEHRSTELLDAQDLFAAMLAHAIPVLNSPADVAEIDRCWNNTVDLAACSATAW